ncbi:uncharacterized protein F5891DRAFT_983838 [Suillus fuscotomentosus]|uniref:Uncharacterized protein n=1 Tax=Suillus fuscotomentosus TaxID=1912939 RepID=A0AAD4DXN4_9AGAM|nr:uncharacterized protein F5891DRAFT_983838 [Suillus fuscotomentosus]KAG1895990.1 hypothetical protein F5891DRAFT_983838 [Suillus fuscotomentosus]
MAFNLPTHRFSAFRPRYNLYSRPPPHSLRESLKAYEIQEIEWSIKALMGSAMDLYLPIAAGSSTYGCVDTAMENDEEVELLSIVSVTNIWGDAAWSRYQSPKKKKLVRGLHKGINKYIDRHCKKHAKTDRLRERMYIALQAALVDVDIDDIMLAKKRAEQSQNDLIPPAVAECIFNRVHNFVSKRVRRSFLFLGAAPTMKLSASSAMYNQTTMPGHFAD